MPAPTANRGAEVAFLTVAIGGLAVSGLVVAIAAALLLHFALGLLILLADIALCVVQLLRVRALDAEDREAFWLFHGNWKELLDKHESGIPTLESERLEPMLDAWFTDLDRLERLAALDDWEGVLLGARQLGAVYRNPRLSRLQFKALTQLTDRSDALYQLDEICANLKVTDIPDGDLLDVMNMIGEGVQSGQCRENEQLKAMFDQLLNRYVDNMKAQDARIREKGYNALLDVMGDGLVEYCGGLIGKPGLHFMPRDNNLFYERLVQGVTLERNSYEQSGKWYPLLLSLSQIRTDTSKRALQALTDLFLGEDSEAAKQMDLVLRGKRTPTSVDLLLPRQRAFFVAVLESWLADGEGRLYRTAEETNLRDLLKGKPLLHDQARLEDYWIQCARERESQEAAS